MAPQTTSSDLRDVRVRLNHYSNILGEEHFYTIKLAGDGSDSVEALKIKISVSGSALVP
jgi:hypothetical protein